MLNETLSKIHHITLTSPSKKRNEGVYRPPVIVANTSKYAYDTTMCQRLLVDLKKKVKY